MGRGVGAAILAETAGEGRLPASGPTQGGWSREAGRTFWPASKSQRNPQWDFRGHLQVRFNVRTQRQTGKVEKYGLRGTTLTLCLVTTWSYHLGCTISTFFSSTILPSD